MDSNTLKTSVDDLYDLVSKKGKITIDEAAKQLRIPLSVVQSVVDYLVEEKIFGIEYKFTTPYIYISDENKKLNEKAGDDNPLATKEEFFRRAQQRGISSEQVHSLWTKYLEENIEQIKEDFYDKSYKKNLVKSQIDILWNKYLTYIR